MAELFQKRGEIVRIAGQAIKVLKYLLLQNETCASDHAKVEKAYLMMQKATRLSSHDEDKDAT